MLSDMYSWDAHNPCYNCYYPGHKNWDNRAHVVQARDLSSIHAPMFGLRGCLNFFSQGSRWRDISIVSNLQSICNELLYLLLFITGFQLSRHKLCKQKHWLVWHTQNYTPSHSTLLFLDDTFRERCTKVPGSVHWHSHLAHPSANLCSPRESRRSISMFPQSLDHFLQATHGQKCREPPGHEWSASLLGCGQKQDGFWMTRTFLQLLGMFSSLWMLCINMSVGSSSRRDITSPLQIICSWFQ